MSDSKRASLEKVASSEVDVESPVVEDVNDKKVNPEEKYGADVVRRTVRLIDFRLLPILGAIYAFSLIDRSNISLARALGMGKELRFDIGDRYSIAAVVFFVPYIIFEFPSNIAIRKVGATNWLSLITVLWGVSMLSMGFVKSWHAVAGLRALLGAAEAGFFPGTVYLISSWYVRKEQQTRLAWFYLTSLLVGGFSPIFAYGVSTIVIAYGMYAWRWLFIICGCITVFLGLIAFFLIVDFPDKAKFLTPDQKELVRERLDYDRGDAAPDPLTLKKAGTYIRDFRVLALSLMFCCTTIPSYAYSLFLPALMAGMGFQVRDQMLLISPPYVFTFFGGLIVALAADKMGVRGPFIIVQALIALVGLVMTGYCTTSAARYAGAFLGVFGSQANAPAILAWMTNNLVGQSKKAFASAMVVGFGGLGGIIASVAFREKDAPKYIPGILTAIVAQVVIVLLTGILMLYFSRRNSAARKGGATIEGTPGFFYIL